MRSSTLAVRADRIARSIGCMTARRPAAGAAPAPAPPPATSMRSAGISSSFRKGGARADRERTAPAIHALEDRSVRQQLSSGAVERQRRRGLDLEARDGVPSGITGRENATDDRRASRLTGSDIRRRLPEIREFAESEILRRPSGAQDSSGMAFGAPSPSRRTRKPTSSSSTRRWRSGTVLPEEIDRSDNDFQKAAGTAALLCSHALYYVALLLRPRAVAA